MKISEYRNQFQLTAGAIDEFSRALAQALSEAKVERLNQLRVRLSIEEAILRMRDRYGESQIVSASIRKRFGNLVVKVETEGDPYNPLSSEENELEDLCSSLLNSVGLSPQYSYSGRINLLRISLPVVGLRPIHKIAIAIIGGVLFGILCLSLFSGVSHQETAVIWTNAVYSAWSRLLNVMMGPILFFMVISTVINAGKISDHGGDNRMFIGRYFLFSFLMGLFALFVSALFYPPADNTPVRENSDIMGVLTSLLHVIPEDILEPFSESNTPQLLFMAFVLGTALILIRDRVRGLIKITLQANMLGLQLCSLISKMVPFVTCILVGLEIWSGHEEILIGLLSCIVVALLASCICIFIVLFSISMTEGITPALLMKKLWKPFWLTIQSGSLDNAYGVTERTCSEELGIDHRFASISLPNGLVLYMPISAVGTLAFIGYASMNYEVTTGPFWYLTAVVFSVVVFAATPPVPGANLLAYIATFAALHIPGDALIAAMVFDIVFGIFASAANQMMLQMELIKQSETMGFLDKEILRKNNHK